MNIIRKTTILTFAFAVVALPAYAQFMGNGPMDGEGPEDRGPRNGILSKIDEDGDGKVSKAEFSAMLNKRHERKGSKGKNANKGKDKRDFFADNDLNNDGKITKEEIKAAHEKRKAERRAEREEKAAERLEQMFAKQDTNGDGAITKEEIEAAKAARCDEIFAKADEDGDGYLSAEELRKAKPKGKGKMGHGMRGGPKGHGQGPRFGGGRFGNPEESEGELPPPMDDDEVM
jgi:Ca2+-binding EF-hand superfamily protein